MENITEQQWTEQTLAEHLESEKPVVLMYMGSAENSLIKAKITNNIGNFVSRDESGADKYHSWSKIIFVFPEICLFIFEYK